MRRRLKWLYQWKDLNEPLGNKHITWNLLKLDNADDIETPVVFRLTTAL